MKEKPAVQDAQIAALLRDTYGVDISRVEFLPIGDISSAKYRLTGRAGAPYFLKLRRGSFQEISLAVTAFLYEHGIRQVLSPLRTQDGRLWTGLQGYTCILYPLIEGRNGFTTPLSDVQWQELGTALRQIHALPLPPELAQNIPCEVYSPAWRESTRQIMAQVESQSYADPLSAEMAALLRKHRDEILLLVNRAEELAQALQTRMLPRVLCHTDIHAGNLLLEANGTFHIIDWDDPMLAPRERDLMFFGGGVGGTWNTAREEALFYQGYGPVEIDLAALAYYRFDRIVIDVAEYSRQILPAVESFADRERGLEKFKTAFQPGNVLEIAMETGRRLAGRG